MTKRYLPQTIFEVAACSAAQLHLLGKATVEEMAQQYWNGYKKNYIDDGVASSIAQAANEGIAVLKQVRAQQPESFFHHLKWYCACFGPDGYYIRKGFFDGTFFQKPEPQDPDRVAHFLEKLKRYYLGLTHGLPWYPPAPDGWSLQTKKMWNPEVRMLTSFTIPSDPGEANPSSFPSA